MNLGYWGVTWAILVPGILYASWVDGKEKRVPNWLNALLLSAGILAQCAYHGWDGLWASLAGALVGFGLLIGPWLMHGMGAGDVKLMAAIGAWLGVTLTLWSFVLGAVFGGVIAIVMIIGSRKIKYACANMTTIAMKMSNPSQWFTDFGGAKSFGNTSSLLPYGIPLTMGTITVLIGLTNGWWGF